MAMQRPCYLVARGQMQQQRSRLNAQDLEDTTGSWELYGTDDNRRYPSLQNEFFERAAAPLTRRESALAFIFTGACGIWRCVAQEPCGLAC